MIRKRKKPVYQQKSRYMTERLCFDERKNQVRRYETTRCWGSTQWHRSTKSRTDLGQSKWYQNLGKMECVFSLNGKMRWKWGDVYLLRGLPDIYIRSLCPHLLPLYLCATAVAAWRWTSRPWSSVFGDTLGDWNHVNSEMHFEAGIERVWRCTWRPRDRVNS